MPSFLGVTLVSALALLGSSLPGLAEAEQSHPRLEAFSSRLQSALNADFSSPFDGVAISELQHSLTQRYQRFRQDFPEITWMVEPGSPMADGRETLLLRVGGHAESEGCATGWKQ